MRVAVVDPYYPSFVSAFYGARAGLADAPYESQLTALLEGSFGTSDAYSFHLRERGHEALEIVPNADPLQVAWAREHRTAGIERAAIAHAPGPFGRQTPLRRLALAQIEAFAPDIVYCQALNWFSPRQLSKLRRDGRLVVGQIASPLPSQAHIGCFDLILTSFPHFVERIERQGTPARFLPLAVDERLPARVAAAGGDASPLSMRPYDVVFVGGVDPRVHGAGTAFLELIAGRRGIDVWGYGADRLPASSPVLKRHHGDAWGLDMYRVLASGRIAINRHIDAAEGFANNMRLFEAAAMGALVLTEEAPNLSDLFEPGREVVTYSDPEDALEKIEHYLGAEDERLAIAAAGQRRALEQHSYRTRIDELIEILESALRNTSG
jgi:spore maturation protein CgeB